LHRAKLEGRGVDVEGTRRRGWKGADRRERGMGKDELDRVADLPAGKRCMFGIEENARGAASAAAE
jgi:hypothetical protein